MCAGKRIVQRRNDRRGSEKAKADERFHGDVLTGEVEMGVWRLRSLLLDSCIDFASNSFVIALLILSVSITLDEGSDRLFL